MDEPKDILACPFCGTFALPLEVSRTANAANYQQWCHHCGALGPKRESVETAHEAWNRRAGGLERRTTACSQSCSIDWLDALAQELDRRAVLADKNAACPDSSKLLRAVASSCLVVIEAAHRADSESASNVAISRAGSETIAQFVCLQRVWAKTVAAQEDVRRKAYPQSPASTGWVLWSRSQPSLESLRSDARCLTAAIIVARKIGYIGLRNELIRLRSRIYAKIGTTKPNDGSELSPPARGSVNTDL